MRTETEVLEKKKNAIQAGLFLAREGLFMNSPDVAQTVTQANNGTISCVTYSTSSKNNAPIFGVTVVNTPGLLICLTDLGSNKYQLKHPIIITVLQDEDGEWIATFPEAELSRSGATFDEAIDWLKSSMVDLYELFNGEDQLGPLPQRQLLALGQHIGQKSHRTR